VVLPHGLGQKGRKRRRRMRRERMLSSGKLRSLALLTHEHLLAGSASI
jgi:hypothetical protein